ncbi:MAG TPA: O-antigen ligase family protein [Anaerolineae bacterium]|nr:O-antigen ligase family protein [Anaerolineae bacterium]
MIDSRRLDTLVDRVRGLALGGGWRLRLALIGACFLLGFAGGLALTLVHPLLILALLGGMAAGLAMLRSTQLGLFGLVAVICLLPFGAIPFSIGFYPTFLDVTLLAVFGVWLARVLTRTQEGFVSSPLDLPILVFILLAFVVFIAGSAHAGVTKDTLRHFAEIIIAVSLFFVVTNSVRRFSQLKQILILIILAGFAASVMGVILYFVPHALAVRLLSMLRVVHYPSGWGVLWFIEDNPSLPMRAISTSVNPNVLGGLLILIITLTTPQLFARKPLIPRKWLVPMLAAMLVCLLLTFSRGSFVAIGASLSMLGVIRYRRLLPLMALVLVLILILPQTREYILHLQAGFLVQDRATEMRMGEYKDALTLISRYPWFGVGFGGTPSIDIYIGVSNVYLLIAEEMGVIGLGAFLLIMGLFFAYAWQTWRGMERETEAEPLLLGLAAALFGAMVGGLTDHYFFNLDFPHSVSMFWLYAGLTVVTIKVSGGEGSRPELAEGAGGRGAREAGPGRQGGLVDL